MFLAFVVVGVVLGTLHNVFPGPHHLRFSAVAVALAGSWFGAFCAAAFVQGTFATMGWVTLVGSIVGAIVHLAVGEFIVHRITHAKRFEGDLDW